MCHVRNFYRRLLRKNTLKWLLFFENSIIRLAVGGISPNQLRLHLSIFLLNVVLHFGNAEFLLTKTQSKIKTINLSRIINW